MDKERTQTNVAKDKCIDIHGPTSERYQTMHQEKQDEEVCIDIYKKKQGNSVKRAKKD